MSIEYYLGMEGPTIVLESPEELYEAIDILHTQVMDNLDENQKLMRILEEAMDKIDQVLEERDL